MKLNDIDDKKIEHRRNNVIILQLQQFAGMLLFLVANRIYKSDSSDKLLQVMFMTSYLVFLGVTVKSLNDYNRLYYDIKKKKESREKPCRLKRAGSRNRKRKWINTTGL